MNDEKVLLGIAVVAVLVSVPAAGITYFSISGLFGEITGYVSEATANLTVESLAIVNFTANNLSWGSGRVDSGKTKAYLTTLDTDNVTDGNWTLRIAGGLRIVNIGNVNVSLNLSGGKTPATFIGGTSPAYTWNISVVEPGSCVNKTGTGEGGLDINTYHEVNVSADDYQACYALRFEAANDEVRIDFNITIPEDSSTGALTDTITATVNTLNPTGG
jgi:hypothetical protein